MAVASAKLKCWLNCDRYVAVGTVIVLTPEDGRFARESLARQAAGCQRAAEHLDPAESEHTGY